MINTIRVLLVVIALLCGLAVWQRGTVATARLSTTTAEQARDAARDELSAAQAALGQARTIIDTERRRAAAAAEVAARYEQEKADALATHDRVVADLRNGQLRLHARWQASIASDELSSAAAGAAIADAAAPDREESAGRIVQAAAQCDAQVRALQVFALLCSDPEGGRHVTD